MAVYEYFTSQKQWEVYLKDLLRTNDNALVKAVTLIYDNQTSEEKNGGKSIENNCVGFSKIDANEMGKIAKKIKNGEELTKDELAKLRNKMQKYWKQLMIISKKKAEAKKIEVRTEQVLREHNEILRQCFEEGKQCEYGICDECSITTGFQL